MSFKDLTKRAAAVLKPKPVETSEKEHETKSSKTGPEKPVAGLKDS